MGTKIRDMFRIILSRRYVLVTKNTKRSVDSDLDSVQVSEKIRLLTTTLEQFKRMQRRTKNIKFIETERCSVAE